MPSAGALKLEGLVVQMNMHPSLFSPSPSAHYL
jgi:hypothetical protein